MALIILGSGFDIDLGLKNSFADYNKYHLCVTFNCNEWNDFENELRKKVIEWYNNGMNEDEAKELNQLWRHFVWPLSFFFTHQSDEAKTIREDSHAYTFLSHLTETSTVYSFNYTDPYDYIPSNKKCQFINIHGQYVRDTYNKPYMVCSQSLRMIVGIDECIPKEGIQNEYIRPMVKRYHRVYEETNIVNDLRNAEIVIFYGFAMGLVDFHYFKEFFHDIRTKSNRCKVIYYVTLNENSFNNFIERLGQSGENLEDIQRHIPVIPIYTENPTNTVFEEMLTLI